MNEVGVERTLKNRAEEYGDFTEQAQITQMIMVAIQTEKLDIAPPYVREAVHMIASKLARIANGTPLHRDSWHDIQGYAKLVEDRIPE